AKSNAARQPDTSVDASSNRASAAPFRTRHATFVPASFGDLPGWSEDNLDEAWKALRASCAVLARKPAWSGVCSRSTRVQVRADAIRRFLEAEFVVYQIRRPDQSSEGIVTGYYEPLLNGSNAYGGKYRYPVYGVPPD